MRVIVDLCVVPVGIGVSVSSEVAACQRVLDEAGLKSVLHAYGTNIEGDWDRVFAAVRRCHEVVHEMGAPRISTVIKVGTRIDRVQTMEDKVRQQILVKEQNNLKRQDRQRTVERIQRRNDYHKEQIKARMHEDDRKTINLKRQKEQLLNQRKTIQ